MSASNIITFLLIHHGVAVFLALFCLFFMIVTTNLTIVHFRLVGISFILLTLCIHYIHYIPNISYGKIAHNMTTQDYRKQNYRYIGNPIYDKGIWKNIVNELFTYHPSMVASTVVSSQYANVTDRGSSCISKV